jgi:hypothetical protein
MSNKSLEELEKLSEVFNTAMEEIKKESENFWNSFSKNDQLKLFCAVSRRIFEGELEQKGSYRYILYNIFGFDTSAYAQAQYAGYVDIHNAIYDKPRFKEKIKKLLIEFGKLNTILTEEDLENRVNTFIKNKL